MNRRVARACQGRDRGAESPALHSLRVDPAVMPAWAEGLSFALPRALVERLGWSPRVSPTGDLPLGAGDVSVDAVRAVREFAAFTETPPASARLPISYRRVPAWARSAVASTLGRRQRRRAGEWAAFPGWPLDLTADL